MASAAIARPSVHHHFRPQRSGSRRQNASDKSKEPADKFPQRRRVPEKPKDKTPFRPQPGDVILRMLPPTPSLTTERVLGVMGLIRIYADDYYFVYEHGHAHIVKFTFRSRDRILRVGQFTSRIYHWKFEEMASLYIYWQADPARRGKWHKIAQQGNEYQEYLPVTADEQEFEREGDTTGDNIFRVMAGDFVIHPLPVVAYDRPWGQSFELRVIPPYYYGTPEMFGAGDVVVRVRLSIPTRDDVVSGVPYLALDIVSDYMDEFVPMYVYGFLCLGKSLTGYGGMPQAVWNGRWRYLGYDHQVFRDYQKVRRSADNQALNKYSFCPLLPGDIMINLDEVLHPPGANPAYHQGHVKIHGDNETYLDRPQDLPGTMIVRLGRFMTPEGRSSTDLELHRTRWLERGRRDGYPYSCWVEHVSPNLIIRDQLAENHWIDANLHTSTRLNDEPAPGDGQVYAADERPFGLGFEPNGTELYQEVLVGVFLQWNIKDLVFNNAVRQTNVGEMFLRPQSDILRVGDRTYVEDRDDQADIVFREENQVFHHEERMFNLFCFEPEYPFKDGDHVIRFKCEESTTQQGCWVLSVELYCHRSIPSVWAFEARRARVWAFKGKDQIILPNLAGAAARRPPGLCVEDE